METMILLDERVIDCEMIEISVLTKSNGKRAAMA